MTTQAELTAIRQAVREAYCESTLLERPLCGRCDMPPPSAIASERFVIAAILDGRLSERDFGAPPLAGDLYEPLHRAAVEALVTLGWPRPVDLAALAQAMHAAGHTGPLEEALVALRDALPMCVHLKDAAAAVREMARRRRLSAFLREIDAGLRSGLGTDAALDKLKASLERRARS